MPEENIGKNSLNEVAKAAATKTGLKIELSTCQDSLVGWLGTNAHPLQELETIHQKVVHQTARGFPAGSDEQREAEFNKLSQFYSFQATDPTLLKEEPPVEDNSPVTLFDQTLKSLKNIIYELNYSSLSANNDPDYFNLVKTQLLDVLLNFDKVHASFVDFPEHDRFQNANVPILLKVEDSSVLWRAFLNEQAINCNDLIRASRNIHGDIALELKQAVIGLAKISMIFSIEPFYLYRLLVPFRVVSRAGVSQDDRQAASSELTDLINNTQGPMDWIPLWLESKIIELDGAITELDPTGEDVMFHLKGGRAQACLLNSPGQGRNDWDTGIVINPDLPAEYWHVVFNKVYNLVLQKLRKFKQEFFMLLHLHADEVTVQMLLNRTEQDDDLLDALDESNLLNELVCDPGAQQGSCKAELIDIGIPRRDSVEGMEHWYHTRPHITRDVNELPIPGYLYYIDEYLLMIREAFAGLSQSPHKISKRIRRIFQVLNVDNIQDTRLDDLVVATRLEVENSQTMPQSLAVIDGQGLPIYISRLLPIMLKQMIDAYNLINEPGLAPLVDASFRNVSATIPNIVIPPAIAGGIANDRDWVPGNHNLLTQWFALANEVSSIVEQNYRDRGEFFGYGSQPVSPVQHLRRNVLETFIRDIYGNSAFSNDNKDLEVRFAVCGDLASYFHAEEARSTTETRSRMSPVSCIELKIFCRNENADPNTVRDAMILPAVNAYINNPVNQQFNIQTGDDGCVYVYWPNEETLGHLFYHPLVVKISVVTNSWPQVTYLNNLPVLSLRELIREYHRNAANTAEWGRCIKLKETAKIMTELLTIFDH